MQIFSKRLVQQFASYKKFNFKDCLNLESLLTEDEKMIQALAADYAQNSLQPRVQQQFLNETVDRGIFTEMGELGFFGCTLKDDKHDLLGVSSTAYGLMNREIERVDSAYRSTLSVQSSLVMFPIHSYGNQEQVDKYIPKLQRGEFVGCFGLSEPNSGSDPGSLTTNAKKDGNDYILNGTKMWITNSPIADVFVVWAYDQDKKLKGFILEKDFKGLTAPKIENKLSLKASITGQIVMDDVRVPKENMLNVTGFQGPFSCLNNARFGISWGVIGAAESCYHTALDYTLERKQFNNPLASNQIIQKKFADMQTEIALALQSIHQVSQLKDNGMISLMKRNNCMKSLAIARECRDLLGGNGIMSEYNIMRHVINLETVNTYEGTNDIHALILGRAITGIQSFQH